jgi:hypothetical protein
MDYSRLSKDDFIVDCMRRMCQVNWVVAMIEQAAIMGLLAGGRIKIQIDELPTSGRSDQSRADPRVTNGPAAKSDRLINQSINQPINQSANQSVDQSIYHSANQSVDQSINQISNHQLVKQFKSINHQRINRYRITFLLRPPEP